MVTRSLLRALCLATLALGATAGAALANDVTTGGLTETVELVPAAEPVVEPVVEPVATNEATTEPFKKDPDRVVETAVEPTNKTTEPIKSAAEPIVETVSKTARTKTEPAREPVKNAAEPVVETVSKTVKEPVKKAKKAVAPVVETLTDAAEPVIHKATQTISPITETVDPVVGPITEVAEPIVQPVTTVLDEAAGVIDPVADELPKPLEPVAEVFRPVLDPVVEDPTGTVVRPVVGHGDPRLPVLDPSTHSPITTPGKPQRVRPADMTSASEIRFESSETGPPETASPAVHIDASRRAPATAATAEPGATVQRHTPLSPAGGNTSLAGIGTALGGALYLALLGFALIAPVVRVGRRMWADGLLLRGLAPLPAVPPG